MLIYSVETNNIHRKQCFEQLGRDTINPNRFFIFQFTYSIKNFIDLSWISKYIIIEILKHSETFFRLLCGWTFKSRCKAYKFSVEQIRRNCRGKLPYFLSFILSTIFLRFFHLSVRQASYKTP